MPFGLDSANLNHMTWPEAFVAYVTKLGKTDLEVAQELKIAPSFIHYWRKGATPREELRKKVAKWSKNAVPWELHVRAAG